MKCVLVFIALLAAWMTSSETAKTCEEINSCASGMASMDQSKMNEACDAIIGVFTCFKEAIADCHVKHPDMMEQQKSAIQSSMNQLKSFVNEKCELKIGQDCTAKPDKCLTGATCTGTPKKCTCPDGKTPNDDNTKCSSASAVASVLLMVAAFLSSRWM